jgi:hypothetical protein
MNNKPQNINNLFAEIKQLIEEAKQMLLLLLMQLRQFFIGILESA